MTKNRKIMIGLIASILAVFVIIIWFIFIQNNHSQNASHPFKEASSLDESVMKDKKEDMDDYGNDITTESDIREVSDKIIEGLHNRDMQTLDSYVHQEKGLIFPPIFI